MLMTQDVVNRFLGYIPRHTLFLVFLYKIAVFTSKLAVLGDNKRDIFCHTMLPRSSSLFSGLNRHIRCSLARNLLCTSPYTNLCMLQYTIRRNYSYNPKSKLGHKTQNNRKYNPNRSHTQYRFRSLFLFQS